MRQAPNGRRPRGRPNRKPHGGPSRPGGFDSNGPEGRIRGNAHQVYEKYIGLARDALSAGDRLSAETYYQHAEHYFRIVNSSTDPEPAERRQPRGDGNGRGEGEPTVSPGVAAAEQARAPEARSSEDREGLDRALGADGQESQRQPPDQPQGRRRPRQRAEQPGDPDGRPAGRGRPPTRGNGQAQIEADGQDSRVAATPAEPALKGPPKGPPEGQDAGEADNPGETTSGNEPVGT